jgi:hypothetical protein
LFSEAYRLFLERMLATTDASEISCIERRVATARVFLAVFAMVAFLMEPTERGHSLSMYGLLGFYMVYSILVLIFLRWEKASITFFRLLVHAADVVWPAFISVFAVGPRSPFFLFFVFVLMAAAYRWGLWATLNTASAEVALLWTESFALLHVRAIRQSTFSWHGMECLRFNVTEFEPKRLFVFSVYLLVAGLVLGYLARQKKHLSIGRVVEPR